MEFIVINGEWGGVIESYFVSKCRDLYLGVGEIEWRIGIICV